MKPNHIYIIKLINGKVFDCVFRCRIRSANFFASLPFILSSPIPDAIIDDSEIEWAEEIMEFDVATTEAKYRIALEKVRCP